MTQEDPLKKIDLLLSRMFLALSAACFMVTGVVRSLNEGTPYDSGYLDELLLALGFGNVALGLHFRPK